MASQDREVAAFPLQDSLTLPLHIKSVEQGSKDFAALFSGQASSLCRTLPAGALVDALVAEAQEILSR
jgi:nitronate monooxygenase